MPKLMPTKWSGKEIGVTIGYATRESVCRITQEGPAPDGEQVLLLYYYNIAFFLYSRGELSNMK